MFWGRSRKELLHTKQIPVNVQVVSLVFWYQISPVYWAIVMLKVYKTTTFLPDHNH